MSKSGVLNLAGIIEMLPHVVGDDECHEDVKWFLKWFCVLCFILFSLDLLFFCFAAVCVVTMDGVLVLELQVLIFVLRLQVLVLGR